MKPSELCSLKCLKNKDRINEIITKVNRNPNAELVLPYKLNGYKICYAPVGNYTKDPLVIISGKTTSGDSSDLFRDYIYVKKNLQSACIMSIYSNMKDRLFKYLNEIRLFDYLAKYVKYWDRNDKYDRWKSMFSDKEDNLKSGIQITQAFNCAILNKERSKRSSQPPKKIFDIIQSEIGCMFEHFRISDKLRLIIFLDTPNKNYSFHQEYFWDKYYKNKVKKDLKIISITHPSAQNAQIYNNLANLDIIEGPKKGNAIKLLEKAKIAVQEILI